MYDSQHPDEWAAELAARDAAKRRVAQSLGADPDEFVTLYRGDRDAYVAAKYDEWHEKARGLRRLIVLMVGTAVVVWALVWAAVTF